MSDTVIRVENLCKKYIIGHHKQERYETFRDRMNHMGRGLLQRLRHPLSANKEHVDFEEFWALRDINFEIKRGDRIGIIGRNGAGKSTLLKILSRITEPTSGRVTIKGRVASLLEVGTGFHPELTGRENIFLNGAILGMSRVEIKKKFDEIVEFAEIEKFLDTPVKRYSSGMYVRLAFAVAAHLEPEILLVDEVLAVGDAEFQKKCLGKMKDVGEKGRTVIFVSHNMRAVSQLCKNAILLHQGMVHGVNDSLTMVSKYLSISTSIHTKNNIDYLTHNRKPNNLYFNKINLYDNDKKSTKVINFLDNIHIFFEFTVTSKLPRTRIGITIKTVDDVLISALHQTDSLEPMPTTFYRGRYFIEINANIRLMPGDYKIGLFAKPMPGFWNSPHDAFATVDNALSFSVERIEVIKKKLTPNVALPSGALIMPESKWKITQ